MCCSPRGGGLLGALAVPLVVAGLLAGGTAAAAPPPAVPSPPPAAASPPPCPGWTGTQPASPGAGQAHLGAVTVSSPCDAWAVGALQEDSGVVQALAEHWDGSNWAAVPAAGPAGESSSLGSVRAVSAHDVWAAGWRASVAGPLQAMIVHWDGSGWSVVPGARLGSGPSRLNGLWATSASSVWAVGSVAAGGVERTLIEHWDGTAWTRQPSPSPGQLSRLFGVTATSPGNAWAVGVAGPDEAGARPLILHWNGTSWTRDTSFAPGTRDTLLGVTATSAVSAWAVGTSQPAAGPATTLVVHWDGKTWARQSSPGPGGTRSDEILTGVAATSAGNALAVGETTGTAPKGIILRWDGTRWSSVPVAGFGLGGGLAGVAAFSASSAWAVGDYTAGGRQLAFALHCC